MKRLLAAGYPDIYSICRVFRGGEKGRTHLPEFTMIEWYRHSLKLGAIVQDAVQLIAAVLERPDLLTNIVRQDYASVFADGVGIDPFSAPLDDLAAAVAAESSLRDALLDDRDAWLDLIMATRIATEFQTDKLTVVQHYPASQAALARICPDNAMVADRFEIYYGTLELANGYVELTNADEQRRRFDQDIEKRKHAGQSVSLPDAQLLAALDHGLPDCAGVAVGLERLQMIYAQADNIAAVVTFI